MTLSHRSSSSDNPEIGLVKYEPPNDGLAGVARSDWTFDVELFFRKLTSPSLHVIWPRGAHRSTMIRQSSGHNLSSHPHKISHNLEILPSVRSSLQTPGISSKNGFPTSHLPPPQRVSNYQIVLDSKASSSVLSQQSKLTVCAATTPPPTGPGSSRLLVVRSAFFTSRSAALSPSAVTVAPSSPA